MTQAYKLCGSIVPMVSPLNKDETIDAAAVKRIITFQKRAGTNALFLLGTCGEGACLSDDEKERLVEAGVANACGLPVLVGVSETATKRAVLWTRKIEKYKATAIVVLPPTFQFAMTVSEHITHIKAIAECTNLPIIVYNLPKKTGGTIIPLEAIKVLVGEKVIIGIKDSCGNLDYIQELVELRREFPYFSVMNGELRVAAKALKLGVDGLVMSYTNIDPKACIDLITSVKNGDNDRAAMLQEEFIDLWNSFSDSASPVGKTKAILSGLGFCQPFCCMPTETLEPAAPDFLKEKYL